MNWAVSRIISLRELQLQYCTYYVYMYNDNVREIVQLVLAATVHKQTACRKKAHWQRSLEIELSDNYLMPSVH